MMLSGDLWGDSVPLWTRVVIRPGLDLGVQAVLVLIPEGRVAHQQDVEDHTWHEREHYHFTDIFSPGLSVVTCVDHKKVN